MGTDAAVATTSSSSTEEKDPEIAALEARLAALKKAKAAGKKPDDGSELVTGAVFRDALLLALGERKIAAAQLQSFFVKQRKSTAKEALAAVSSFALELEQRDKENAEEENAVKKDDPEAVADNNAVAGPVKDKTAEKAPSPSSTDAAASPP